MSVDVCPKCHRKLLTHSSAKCNWCGEVIPDQAYQNEAAAERDASYMFQGSSVAGVSSLPDAIAGPYGSLKRYLTFQPDASPMRRPRPPLVKAKPLPFTPVPDAQLAAEDGVQQKQETTNTTEERARHIEF